MRIQGVFILTVFISDLGCDFGAIYVEQYEVAPVVKDSIGYLDYLPDGRAMNKTLQGQGVRVVESFRLCSVPVSGGCYVKYPGHGQLLSAGWLSVIRGWA